MKAARAALLLWLWPAWAAAHGVAQSYSVAVRPGASPQLLVGTSFGAVISPDRGASWRVICEEAIGYSGAERPAWWLSPTGATFAATAKGVYVGRGDGCSWQGLADFEPTGASDLRGQGGTLLATTARYGAENRILRSVDDGLSWRPAERSASLLYTSVQLAPSNPQRVYAAAWWFSPAASVLLRSDDNGLSFTQKDLGAALPAAGLFHVLAVHPTRPQTLFAAVYREAAPAAGWLLKSIDSGDTFSAVLLTGELVSAVAFGADPRVVYAAAGNGLYRSLDEGQSFNPLPAPQRNACLATLGAEVFSCGLQELDGWAVGRSDGGAFAALLTWGQIAGPLPCPAGSEVATVCEPIWPLVVASFPSSADAGADGGAQPSPPRRGCGCGAVDGPLWAAAILFLRRRRRCC